MTTALLADLDGILLDGLEFCRRAYGLLERIRQSEDGPGRLRLRASTTEKKLLEEILPICKYIQLRYRAGRYISVRWIDGDQTFDAEIHQQGALVNRGYYPESAFLEVTCAMHENEHWTWKLLSSGRVAFAPEGITKPKGKEVVTSPVVFTNDEHVQNFVPIVHAKLCKKADLAYPPETSLVVQCSLNSLYTPDDWDRLVSEVERQIPANSFREILLFDAATEYTSNLYRPRS